MTDTTPTPHGPAEAAVRPQERPEPPPQGHESKTGLSEPRAGADGCCPGFDPGDLCVRCGDARRWHQTPDTPARDAGLRERITGILTAAGGRYTGTDADHLADAVMAVRDRYLEQTAAGRATWKRKAEEIERDRDLWQQRAQRAEAELAEYERIRATVTKGARLGRPLTVSDVLVAHEVTRKALADALGQGYHLNWSQLVQATRRTRAHLDGADTPTA